MYFLDTNSIIYYFKGVDKMVSFFDFLAVSDKEINLSVITKIELLSFDKETEIKKIKKLLANSNVLPLDDKIIDQTIKVRKKYKLKLPDAIIAATALSNNLVLVTHNIKDFKKIKNLKIIDPLE